MEHTTNTFKSKYTENTIGPAQYLAEFMCERLAKKNGQTLGTQFWNQPRWKVEFKKQLFIARGILKLYSINAILNVLRSNKGYNVYSLGAQFLDPLIKAEDIKLRNEASQVSQQSATIIKDIESIAKSDDIPNRQVNDKKSTINLLKE